MLRGSRRSEGFAVRTGWQGGEAPSLEKGKLLLGGIGVLRPRHGLAEKPVLVGEVEKYR